MGNDQNKDRKHQKKSTRRSSEPGNNTDADDRSSEPFKKERVATYSKNKIVESPNVATVDTQYLKKSYSFRTPKQTDKISFVQNDKIGGAEHTRVNPFQPNTVPKETFNKNIGETSVDPNTDNKFKLMKGSETEKVEGEQLSSSTLKVGHTTNIAGTADKDNKKAKGITPGTTAAFLTNQLDGLKIQDSVQADNQVYKFEQITAKEPYEFEKINIVKELNDSDREKELPAESSTWPVLLVEDSSENLEHSFNRSLCNDCLKKLNFEKLESECICFSCETYLCSTCIHFHQHHRHSFPEKADFARTKRANHDINVEKAIDMMLDELTVEDDSLEKLEHETKSLCDRIDIKHSKDIKDCWVRNIAILKSGIVAVTDSENNSIKLLDLRHNIHRRIKLSEWPCGIAELLKSDNSATSSTGQSVFGSLNDEQQERCLIATTCPFGEVIMILDITKSPAVAVRCISVHRQCFNMIIYKGEFVFVCNSTPSSIYFITESGEISKIIELYNGNLPLQDWYPRIEIHSGTETLYVSSYDDNAIFAMNLEGQVFKSFTHDNLLPYGIVVNEDQTVFLCSESNNTVYKLSRHFETLETLIDEKDCALSLPAALARHKTKLYVSSDSKHHPNTITVISIV